MIVKTSEIAPLANATLIIFDSFVAFRGVPRDVHLVSRHLVILFNDQVGTLRLRASRDGTTWKVVDSVAVAIPVAPLETTGPVDFAVEGLPHYQVIFINGGTNQGAEWTIYQEITEHQRQAQT